MDYPINRLRYDSVAVRAAYAFGDWPPACADPICPRPEPHVKHGAGEQPATEAPARQADVDEEPLAADEADPGWCLCHDAPVCPDHLSALVAQEPESFGFEPHW